VIHPGKLLSWFLQKILPQMQQFPDGKWHQVVSLHSHVRTSLLAMWVWFFMVCLHMLLRHGASLQFFRCSPLIVNFCGGSLWFFTCSSLLVTWRWCFFAVLHMLSFNSTWVWCFFVVLHTFSFNYTWVCSSCGYWWFFTCSSLLVHGV
jgi:hypothetical protein